MSLGVTNRDDRPVVILDLEYRSAVSEIIGEEAERRNWRLVNAGAFKNVIPRGMSPAGAIGTGGPKDELAKAMLEMGVPYVRLGYLPSYYWNNLPSVFASFEDTGPLAARYFAGRGFRHLAYVGNVPWGEGRIIFESFDETAKALGCERHLFRMRSLQVHPDVSDRKSWLRKQAEALAKWLGPLPKPLGLLAYSDRMAAKLCLFCLEGGLRVPGDVAILGIGNDRFFCETAPVALSSIDLSWDLVGREACNLLQSLMAGGSPPERPLLITPQDIHERRSTDVMAVSDPVVANAMQFIWDNIGVDIPVDDLACEMGVSRRILEQGFKKCIGHGINAELRRKRMEVAEELLRKTDLKIGEVARKVGFNSMSYFHRFFSKKHGMTPTEFRKQFSQQPPQAG